LDAVANRIKVQLTGMDASELRESDNLRSIVAESAESILAQVSDYLS
jgi:hypothetical protein